MRSLRSLRGNTAAAKPIIVAIVAIMMVTSTVGAYVLLFAGSSGGDVKAGDKITVDYIGKFADGRVFDTSMWDVASNDSAYPKSLFFAKRSNETQYSPMEFIVGSGGMIVGFDQGVRGMNVGDTKTFTVSVADGYGPRSDGLTKTMQMGETIEITQSLDKAAFKAMFGADPATSGGFRWVTHARLGIEAQYYATSSDVIEVTFHGKLGDEFTAYGGSDSSLGWKVVVTNKTSSTITVRHQLTADDNFMVKGYDPAGLQHKEYVNGVQYTNTYRYLYVDDVDEDAGTFSINYVSYKEGYSCRETTGHVLTFTVTVLARA